MSADKSLGVTSNNSQELAVVILAAGLGKRMNSSLPKVLHSAYGKPLLTRVLENAATVATPDRITVVVGAGREEVTAALHAQGFAGKIAVQTAQRGTGDAVKAAMSTVSKSADSVLVLYGDVPLLRSATLRGLIHTHHETKSSVTFLTLKTKDQTGYGRVVRDAKGHVVKIVERKDCNDSEYLIDELNSGVMIIDAAFLAPALDTLQDNNSQKEYYLTDIVGRAVSEGQRVSTVTSLDELEVQGVNTPQDLALVERALMRQRVSELENAGVYFASPSETILGSQVKIQPGVRIGLGCELIGETTLESNVVLEGYARLENCFVEKGSLIKWCTRAEGAHIGADCAIGPFAHLRPGTVLERDVRIGNFVETKNAKLGIDAKASHLTYLGDAEIGDGANIGAGTITCNYDGKVKSKTIVGAGAFIGSNTSLVAPVTVGANATIAAGSVITKDVAANSLAFGRARQVEKLDWKKTTKSE